MTAYRVVRTLSTADAAYIAGLIDGEGTIALTRRHKHDHRQLALTISNTEMALLAFVRNAIGAGRITSKLTYQHNHTPSFVYGVFNRQALAVLKQIEPYLQSYKAGRAKLVLADYLRLTPRNGKYRKSQLAERARFIEAFFSMTANENGRRPLRNP